MVVLGLGIMISVNLQIIFEKLQHKTDCNRYNFIRNLHEIKKTVTLLAV